MKRRLPRRGASSSRPRPRTPKSGFTLVELLLVVAILGIVAAVAMPSLGRVTRILRIESSAQALVGDLNRARTEAIRRNATISVSLVGPASYRVETVGLRRLDAEVAFSTASPDTVRFTAFGSTLIGRETYTLRLGELERRVVLDAAGQASVE